METESKPVDLWTHRFNSLNSYLKPVYNLIENSKNLPDDDKKKVVKEIIGLFFKRCREHREIEIKDVSRRLNLSNDKISEFEEGRVSLPRHIQDELIRQYNIQRQFLDLLPAFDEFRNPGAREHKKSIAKDLFHRFGIIPDGVNFKDLKPPEGQVLEFRPHSS